MPDSGTFDEQVVLQQLSKGSRKALMQLYDQYWKLVYQVVRKRTGFSELAQDVAQDVFIILWERRESLDTVTNFKAYLATVARNLAFRKVQRLQQEIEVTKEFIYRHGRTIADHSMENQMLDLQYNALVNDAVRELTPRQKQIYELAKNEHLSHEEIAERLHITRNAVKKHMSDALVFIRKRIKNHIAYMATAILLMPDNLDLPVSPDNTDQVQHAHHESAVNTVISTIR